MNRRDQLMNVYIPCIVVIIHESHGPFSLEFPVGVPACPLTSHCFTHPNPTNQLQS